MGRWITDTLSNAELYRQNVREFKARLEEEIKLLDREAVDIEGLILQLKVADQYPQIVKPAIPPQMKAALTSESKAELDELKRAIRDLKEQLNDLRTTKSYDPLHRKLVPEVVKPDVKVEPKQAVQPSSIGESTAHYQLADESREDYLLRRARIRYGEDESKKKKERYQLKRQEEVELFPYYLTRYIPKRFLRTDGTVVTNHIMEYVKGAKMAEIPSEDTILERYGPGWYGILDRATKKVTHSFVVKPEDEKPKGLEALFDPSGRLRPRPLDPSRKMPEAKKKKVPLSPAQDVYCVDGSVTTEKPDRGYGNKS